MKMRWTKAKLWQHRAGSRPLLFLSVAVLAAGVIVQQMPTAFADPFATSQLAARWTFDGVGVSENAPDIIGTNHAVPGAGSAAPVPSSEVPPVSYPNTGSMEFNGNNFFTIDNPVSKNFSICAWIKTTSVGGGIDHWTSAPIMDSEVSNIAYDFGFGVGNGGKLMFGNGGVDPDDDPEQTGAYWDDQVNGATTINDNAWHNVCVTRNGDTGQSILYVDAQVDGSGYTGVGTLRENSKARIGWGYDGAELYIGLIDDVRVYDGVLTQAQLARLAAGNDSPDEPVEEVAGLGGQTGAGSAALLADTGQSIPLFVALGSVLVLGGVVLLGRKLS